MSPRPCVPPSHSYMQNVDTGENSGCPALVSNVSNTGGLLTEPPSTDELAAVAVVASFFILVAFILGVILVSVVVMYVRIRQGRYGRTESGKALSGEVYANNGQAG